AGVPAESAGSGPSRRGRGDLGRVAWSQGTAYSFKVRVEDRAGFVLEPAAAATLYVDAPAQVTLTCAAAPGETAVGGRVHVTALFANTGGSEAVNLVPVLPVAEGTARLKPAGPVKGGAVASLAPGEFTTVSWAFEALSPGTVRFTADGRAAAGPTGDVLDVASARSNDVLVRRPARLAVDVAASPANVRPGTVVRIVMLVSNEGEAAARVTSAILRPSRAGLAGPLAGPEPSLPFVLKGGETREMSWTASAAGAGTLAFTGVAAGVDETSGSETESGARTSPPVGIAAEPATIQLAASDGTAVGGTAILITAIIRDAAGIPVPGVSLVFSLLAGKGILAAPAATTDELGQARVPFTLPKEPGLSTVAG
ncbi:MAG: Ig-like domain-containing protein, partial [bacterium]